MSKGFEVRSYDYVNQPYEQVRIALTEGALKIFRDSTKAAATRANSLAASLSVDIAGIEVSTDIAVSVKKIEEMERTVTSPQTTRLTLEWEAAKLPRLFPFMQGVLSVYPLTRTETQLDFLGRYEPPMGAVGAAINTVIGHRIAEAAVHRLLENIGTYLRSNASENS